MNATPVRRTGTALLALVLLAYILARYPFIWSMPFVGDDYEFLDKVMDRSFPALWTRDDLYDGYYRPWSRELHNWTLLRVFGVNSVAFHVASIALWLSIVLLFESFARRVIGARAAGVATAAWAALAGWGVIVVWASGAQELWMQVFALLALHAFARRRDAAAAAAFALALLSKEPAVVALPLLAAYGFIVQRDRAAAIARRLVPAALIFATWLTFRLGQGGGLVQAASDALPEELSPRLGVKAWRYVASLVNLDAWPRPHSDWAAILMVALPSAALLIVLIARSSTGRHEGEDLEPGIGTQGDRLRGGRLVAFALAWVSLAWAPLMVPSVGWHAYYALFGAMGAWLALAVPLARHRAAAALVVAAMTLLSTARTWTPTNDWGTEWFQMRAGAFNELTRKQLMGRYPDLPSHTRVFLTNVPGGVGLMPSDGYSPTLRTWYGDTTLRMTFWSRYMERSRSMGRGPDLFFRYDSTQGWIEVVPIDRDPNPEAIDERWRLDHDLLAATLARGGDWGQAAREYAALGRSDPTDALAAFNLAVSLHALGDSAGAARMYGQVVAMPTADSVTSREARLKRDELTLPRGR